MCQSWVMNGARSLPLTSHVGSKAGMREDMLTSLLPNLRAALPSREL